MKNPWRKLKRKMIYSGFLDHKVFIDQVVAPGGKRSEYFVVSLKDNVVILALTADNKVVMERVWRYPIDREIFELPVGGIDKGESPLQAAKRELFEETGVKGNEWQFLGSHYENDGFCTAKSNIFLVKNIHFEKFENSDENEKIEVELIDFDKLKKMVLDDEIEDARTKLAVLLARDIL